MNKEMTDLILEHAKHGGQAMGTGAEQFALDAVCAAATLLRKCGITPENIMDACLENDTGQLSRKLMRLNSE